MIGAPRQHLQIGVGSHFNGYAQNSMEVLAIRHGHQTQVLHLLHTPEHPAGPEIADCYIE